jgi:hypothetical protein
MSNDVIRSEAIRRLVEIGLLTFGANSGPVPNKADLQAIFDVITERLKRQYDV